MVASRAGRGRGCQGDSGIQAGLKAQEEAKQQLTRISSDIERERDSCQQVKTNRIHAAARITELETRIASLTRTFEAARSEAARIERRLKEKLAGLILSEGRDEAERIDKLPSQLRLHTEGLRDQLKEKRLRLEQLEMRIAEARQKREQIGELERSMQVYLELGTLLRADPFIRFVLEGAFQLLCEEGSRQLLILSQGRYSFAAERDEFYVIDHLNADARRSVRTLSGGESFLASLALALALASSVSHFSDEGSPFRLDALFLEGGSPPWMPRR